MNILELQNVKKSYKLNGNSTTILKDINLSFKKGEFVSILGESGCGKSTLMSIIGGMDSDFEGDVLINQVSLKNMKEKDLDNYRKANIGFIFQNFNLMPHLTVLDNVTLVMEMMDMSNNQRIERAKELLEDVGLGDHLTKKPSQLSGGQKQRVAIARALANNPDIILADEPTGALDKNTSIQILNLLDKIAKRGKLIIAVTHSKKVSDFSSRVISLEDGVVLSDLILKEEVYERQESRCINVEDATEEELEELYTTLYSAKTKNLNLFSCAKLAIRNMKLNFKRNLLVSIGSSIGITSLILMLSIGAGVKNYILEEINDNSNPKVIEISKPTDNESTSPIPEIKPMEKIDSEKISAISNVEKVEPISVKSMSSKINNPENNSLIDIFILSTINSKTTENNVVTGRLPSDNEVMISQIVADSLFKDEDDDYNIIGKKLNVSISELDENNKPVLIETELKVSGIYDMKSPIMDMPMAFIDYETLEGIYLEEELTLKTTQLDVYVKDESNIDDIKETLINMGYENAQTTQLIEELENMLDVITTIFVAISGVSLIVSGVMILVISYINVIERTKEIGVLRAVGARRLDIRNIFLVESSLLGLFSGIIAIILVIITGKIGNEILLDIVQSEIICITSEYLLIGLILSIVISIIAGFIPSNKASNLAPVESLRYE